MTITVDTIRTYVNDTEAFNILLDGELQSGDALISLAMELAISDFNLVPPVTSYVLEGFAFDTVLLYGTLHHLANSEAEKQLRNQVNFSSQGMQSSIDDKQPAYSGLASYYKQLFDSKVKELKTYMNTADAWGENYSPYIGINDFNFRV